MKILCHLMQGEIHSTPPHVGYCSQIVRCSPLIIPALWSGGNASGVRSFYMPTFTTSFQMDIGGCWILFCDRDRRRRSAIGTYGVWPSGLCGQPYLVLVLHLCYPPKQWSPFRLSSPWSLQLDDLTTNCEWFVWGTTGGGSYMIFTPGIKWHMIFMWVLKMFVLI